MSKKAELVAPGGSLTKIEYAYHFGADAAYVGHPDFSLRARLNDFSEANLKKAVALARRQKKKIYFTLNIYAHERHLAKMRKHLAFIKKIKPDAVIVSDPGIMNLLKKHAPKIKIHLSTQANTTNSEAVKFWQSQGVSRIVLAREVTLEEIKRIKKACPKMELEYFVHGAMCMSMSGRCLLSKWMRGRSANLGDCVQPCRWPYRPAELEFPISPPTGDHPQSGNFPAEGEAHQGQQFPNLAYRQAGKSKIQKPNEQERVNKVEKEMIIEEDQNGSYIFNSKDLCLIEHIEKLMKAGISAFKIEGRTKSVFYAAVAAKVYRLAIDAVINKKSRKERAKAAKGGKAELEKLSNRGYTTGFLFGKEKWENNFECSHRESKYQFVGEIIGESKGGWHKIKAHNALEAGEKVEIISPKNISISEVLEIENEKREPAKSAHGGSKNIYFIRLLGEFRLKSLLRKKIAFPK